jgi:hypothetical protein
MLGPQVRVLISYRWVKQKLQHIYQRPSPLEYVLEVYSELINVVESDLNAGLPVCLDHALLVALDTVDSPFMIIDS